MALAPLDGAVLVAVGAATGFVNVVAGGGSLLSIPILIFMGLSAPVANGSARLAILIQGLVAIATFHRRGVLPWRQIAPYIVPVTLGAAAGAALAVRQSDESLRAAFGWVTLAAALLVALRPDRALDARRPGSVGPMRRVVLVLACAGAGLYGGYLQAGVGYLVLAAFTMIAGWPLAQANVAKVVLAAAYMPVVIPIFTSSDQVAWSHAAALAIGAALGAYVGARSAIRRGAGLIRIVLAIMVMACGVMLLVS